jgi:hypothetical protein
MNFDNLLKKMQELDQPTQESMQPPAQAAMAAPSSPEMPMDELSAIRHLSGQPVPEEYNERERAIYSAMDSMELSVENITPENILDYAQAISDETGIDSLIVAHELRVMGGPELGQVELDDYEESMQPQFDVPDNDVLLGAKEEDDTLLGEKPTDEWMNEPNAKVAKLAAVIGTGDDLASKGKEAPKVNGGGNPMQETLKQKLAVMYDEIKEGKKQTMSRAAKGWEKYGDGMEELAKAGREGASEKEMDAIRDKYNKYKK